MKAMIFAAGFGKRLLPLTANTPKPLVKIQNKPILDWITHQLQHYQIDEAIINVHYLAAKIIHHLQTSQTRIKISISQEDSILGTGGGFYKTIDYWDTNDFYLCNSDILCTANLNKFFNYHVQQSAIATLAVNHQISDSMLLKDQQDNLVGIRKKGADKILKLPRGKIEPVGFCGLHAINPKIFKLIEPPAEFSIIDEYLQMIVKGGRIKTWDIGDAYWVDIGSEEGLENANRHFPGFGF